MKLLLTSLLSLLLSCGYANDTLTRAQVYNFNISDTFDYKIEGDHNCPPISHGVSYNRVIITNLRYTNGNNSLIIYRQHLDGSNDSLAIDSLNKYAIDQDYNVCNRNYWIDTAQRLSGTLCNAPPRIFNGVSYNTCVEGSYYYRYGEGLGEIISSVSGGDGTCGSSTLTTLIYYAKGTEHCGTPYNTLTGITEVEALLNAFKLTPNPSSSAITISTNGVAIESIGIYNTAGQLLLLNKQPLNNTIDISSLSSGVYIAEIKTKEGSAMKRWVKM